MIDVIIPAYNAHKTIERTLFSIAYQENIEDIEVTIVNDNSKKDYLEIVNYFKNFMKIKEITLKENRGPGYARQCGIDNTKNPYIVFIDSDDIFYSFNSIKTLYDTITKDDFDYVGSNFIEETEDEKIEIENNDAWVHGKIYKRSFLIENNIKFPNAYAQEDCAFNKLVLLHNAKIKYISDITYIWCYNENSITRKNDREYSFKGLFDYIDNTTWAFEMGIKHKCTYNKIASMALHLLVSIYCYYMEYYNEDGVEEFIKKSKIIYEITKEYEVKDEEEKREIIITQIKSSRNFEDYILNPFITLNEFLQLVEKS